MKTEALLNSLLREVWADIQQPDVIWQLGTVALCLLIAWVLERWATTHWYRSVARRTPPVPVPSPSEAGLGPAVLSNNTPGPGAQYGLLSVQAARAAAGRVVFPAIASALVMVARPVLGQWHHTQLLHVALVLLAALAVVRGIVYVISKLARTPSIAAFERLLVILVWIAVGLYMTGYGDDVIALAESIVFAVGKQRVSLWTVLSASFWVMATLLGGLWLGGVLESRLLAVDTGDMSVRVALARVLRAVLLMMAVLVGLSLVGLDITALSVFGGALGVGIGLGLQRIASSYISGFVVLLERRVRLGDIVTVDKYHGQVTEIRTRFTIVRSGEGWEAIVPNEMLMANPVQNFSKQAASRLKSRVTVPYGTDLDVLMPQLTALAAAHPRVLAEPGPAVFLTTFGPDGLELELGYSIADAEVGRAPVTSEINRSILATLAAEGIEIPYPRRQVRVLNPAGPGYTAAQS
mgnify:CR=1 FL=1